MLERTPVFDETVTNGTLWLMRLVEGKTFNKSKKEGEKKIVHEHTNYNTTVSCRVWVLLPGDLDVTLIPAGTAITFYQPYQDPDRSRTIATIFLRDEQITIKGNGNASHRRY